MFPCRFRPSLVNQMVGKVLKEALADKQYNAEEAKQWSKDISQTLQENLKGTHMQSHVSSKVILFLELELERYKFMVQVVIGELRGEGVK